MTVILLLLRPASLSHKNPQRCKIIHGAGCLRSVDRSEHVFFVEMSNLCNFSGSYSAWLLFNNEYFYLAFVVLENRKTIIILISVYCKNTEFWSLSSD